MNVQREYHRKFNIAVTRIEKPYEKPNILAEYIALQLKNRVSFQQAMSNRSEKAKFPYKQFVLKSITIPIQFELYLEPWA
ncbi:hypothetical protein KSP39_PZI004983 [Platanthera zijinensis]|uniref:Uncharacterized protein n=1 Tax=Platanthera zijinensis TaxID=2320716 RepID=A0AAP0GBK2_9ASPA